MERKILVTGANGFLGRHVVPLLEQSGLTVITPPPHNSGFRIEDKEQVLSLPLAQTVIHLAAIANVPDSWQDPAHVMAVNSGGTANILKYCEQNKSGLILASSYPYGNTLTLPTPETVPWKAENPYAVSKQTAEELCKVFFSKNSLPTTILRIFNLYGPSQSPKMVVSQMVTELVEKGQITIFSGKPKRDYVYVKDTAKAIISVINSVTSGLHTLNVGSETSVSIREVADTLIRVSGKSASVIDKDLATRPNEILETLADISAIHALTGWTPTTSLDDGLKATYEWQIQNSK